MYPTSLNALFTSVGLTYGSFLPLSVVLLLVFFALPGLLRPGARSVDVIKAAYCYLAQAIGVILMTAGALPILQAVLSGQSLSSVAYIGLLGVFASGGLLFLWQDKHLRTIDVATKSVPATLFFYTWKFIGVIVTFFAALSFLLSLLFNSATTETSVMHIVMLIYGVILSWFTLLKEPTTTVVTTRTIAAPPSAAKAPSPKKKGK